MKLFVLLFTFCFIAYAQATSNLRHPTTNNNKRSLLDTYTQLTSNLIHLTGKKRKLMSENQKELETLARLKAMKILLGHFYCDKVDSEGRGRLPGQSKFNVPVPGGGGVEESILNDLGQGVTDGWTQIAEQPGASWVRLCSSEDLSTDAQSVHPPPAQLTNGPELGGDSEIFGFLQALAHSPFQDGCVVYTVVAGGGSGLDHFPPVAYLADIENAVDFNAQWKPHDDYCHNYFENPNWLSAANET